MPDKRCLHSDPVAAETVHSPQVSWATVWWLFSPPLPQEAGPPGLSLAAAARSQTWVWVWGEVGRRAVWPALLLDQVSNRGLPALSSAQSLSPSLSFFVSGEISG